jgi:hypothetical protein
MLETDGSWVAKWQRIGEFFISGASIFASSSTQLTCFVRAPYFQANLCQACMQSKLSENYRKMLSITALIII